MTFDVAYAFSGGHGLVSYPQTGVTSPTIIGTPVVQDAASVTINGTGFSASGNRVFVGSTELPISTESTTQITTTAVTFVRESLINQAQITVTDASSNVSNAVTVLISPATGQRVFAVSQSFLGDPTTRLESQPDLVAGDEILIRAVAGTNVTATDVTVDGNGTTDVASDSDADPNVATYEYAVFDGDQRSATWATVTWSAPVLQTTVPNVVGLSQAAAEAAATLINLVPTVIASLYSATVPVGFVMAQFPPAGTLVEEASVLELTVSLGVAPTLVPNLIGQTPGDAETISTASGTGVGVTYRRIDGFNSGLIVNQSIAPGTEVTPGTLVDITISSNLMPSVLFLDYAAGISLIQAAELIVDDLSTRYEYRDSYPAGTIIRQSPDVDAVVSPFDLVILTVSILIPDTIVPYVISKDAETATLRLTEAHLATIVDPSQPTGTVTAQSVAPFSVVSRGTTVTITLGGAENSPSTRRRSGLPPYGSPDKPQ